MKMKLLFTFAVGLAAAFSATAQKVENDDMYFTSKDRAKLKPTVSANAKVQVARSAEAAPTPEVETAINPTDSYSARNVNPEYSTTTSSTTASKPGGDYFIENYRPTGVNGNLNGNYSSTSTPSAYNSAAMAASTYGMGYSPYSRYGYDGYNPYMGMSPYYGSGMRMSMTYGYGSAFGYNPYMYGGSPYGMYGSMYDPFYDPFYPGMGMGMMSCPYSFYGYNTGGYYGGYGRPNVIVVDNNTINGRQVAYGRRADRSTSTDYQPDGNNRETTQLTRTGRVIGTANGRTRADNAQPYYERGWRSNLSGDNTTTRRSVWSTLNSGTNPGNTTNGGATNWNNSNSGRTSGTSSWGNFENGSSNSGSTRSSWTPSVGGGGGGRSSGTTGGGGGSRGRD
jgi:hypothetical protein